MDLIRDPKARVQLAICAGTGDRNDVIFWTTRNKRPSECWTDGRAPSGGELGHLVALLTVVGEKPHGDRFEISGNALPDTRSGAG